jgi:SAM-dependent methyltransferase
LGETLLNSLLPREVETRLPLPYIFMSQPKELALDVAAEVRDFYDRYPYPPPIESLDGYKQLWQDQQRRLADFHLFWPDRAYREDLSILVAGCGTSQAAKYAVRWPRAQIVGIDCSATSVRHTEELQQRHNLENLQVYHLPIQQVGDLGMTFDQVICTGVLHHLEDPDAGLKSLSSVLQPDGAMHLMVYAPYGRTGIYLLQEFCQRLGIRANGYEIRDLIAALRALPESHPLQALIAQSPDFQDEAALADALLNPQDRAYSVPQLFDLIEGAGLKFGRWLRQAPYSVCCGVLSRIPQSSRIARLGSKEQFAAIELFRGTMMRHSIIAYRNDGKTNSQPFDDDSDDWQNYVPIRLPDTKCIEDQSIRDRLPTGTVAVLINRAHTYKDLLLPISAAEQRIFHAIDGKRSVSEILKQTATSSGDLPTTRTFFERLWWHDQVVFSLRK